jgi:phosphatidylserine decarboxylase
LGQWRQIFPAVSLLQSLLSNPVGLTSYLLVFFPSRVLEAGLDLFGTGQTHPAAVVHDDNVTLAKNQFHPVVREFQELIEGDPEIYMGFTQMFDEIPNTGKYLLDPTGLEPQASV